MSDQAAAVAERRAVQSCRDSCRTVVRWLQARRRHSLATIHRQQHTPPDRHHQRTLDKPDHSTTTDGHYLRQQVTQARAHLHDEDCSSMVQHQNHVEIITR